LVRHLESFGLHCTYAGDIAAGQDALMISDYGDIDAIITNPPYTRDIMHRLITHFQRIAPTWLLLESDWTTTRQAAPFLPCCSDIVAIAPVKWVEDYGSSTPARRATRACCLTPGRRRNAAAVRFSATRATAAAPGSRRATA
jgi:hypothetical protein